MRGKRPGLLGLLLVGSLALGGGAPAAPPVFRLSELASDRVVEAPQQVRLQPGDDLSVICPSVLVVVSQAATMTQLHCGEVTPTPIPPSPTLPPTATRVPTPPPATPTPLPSPTPLPTATPGTVIEGVPVCTDHDPTRYHGLVKRDGAGAILCTYGHEHHDDPNTVNDLFGPPGAWWGGTQAISYPWQTFAFTSQGVQYEMPPAPSDPSVYENARKHAGYKWFVKRDISCWNAQAQADNCFRAFRIQVHSLGTQTDETTRFHSFSMEALVESGGRQGIIRGGGWMNTGFLGLLVDGGVNLVCPALATNPPGFTCPATGTAGGHREVSGLHVPAPHTDHLLPGAATPWYADHQGGVSPVFNVQNWGPTDYNNPTSQLFFEGRSNNATGGRIHALNAATNYDWLAPFKDAMGLVSFRGYEDRHGLNRTTCQAAGLDCVPFIVEHAPAAIYTAHMFAWPQPPGYGYPPDDTLNGTRSWDVLSPVTGNSLVTFPN